MATEFWAAGVVIIATFVAAFGGLFFKLGANKLHRHLKSIILNWRLFLGFLLYGFSSVLFLIALKWGELSVLYPIASFSYVWIVLLSVKLLGEEMNLWKWVGVLVIILGVLMIGIGEF